MLMCVRVTWPAFYFLTEKPEMIPEKRKRVYTARNWSKVFTQVTVSHRCHPNCWCHLVCGIPAFVCKRRMWPMWVDENSEHADWETRIKKGKGKKRKTRRIRGKRAYFFLCRKGSIICHLLGLKVSDEGSGAENWLLKKNGRVYKRRSGQCDIFAGENRRGAGLE